ncbi:Fe-S cluster assembly protein SufD [Chengkuizengella axinellae]|uniref:Fe-S cluster assembly protein SufD n=1 Tax=Chengkuizengella axinellae TaxID=3064388 RepID=A0ABT9J0H1_9BACL|nr:Fe-S cluster assembly protein SufD [Chengkuizengella sp. 2205SS18-9]MDP5275109.1 Fe-S cluster assembly protein SufD [Chengkuizengella sp. 2205SS18-9]
MTTQIVLPIDQNEVRENSQSKNEPEWLSNLRLEALTLAGQLEYPKLEKTNLNRWSIESYGKYKSTAPITSIADLPEAYQEALQDQKDNLLIQRNSNVVFKSLSDDLAKKGVIFTDLETAAKEHPELVQPYFMQAVKKEENKLTAIHTALWSGGVFLYVPKNVEVEIPLQVLFLSEDDSSIFSPHVLIVADTNSSVTYVDHVTSEGSSNELVHNSIVEVFVKSGAKVQFSTLHNLNDSITDLSYRRAVVENDGRIEWIIGEMNDGNCMSDTSTVLKGNGSTSDAKIVCIGLNEQKLNITTNATHFGKNSDSDMITRAVMNDNATAIINGVTKIEHGAKNANGEQTEKVLMLSPTARGDANPMLLIDEDEVTAGHAASVGQVDQNQIYYLMSRGISKETAERLIIYGFLAPVVSEIPIKQVSDQLQALIEGKLER